MTRISVSSIFALARTAVSDFFLACVHFSTFHQFGVMLLFREFSPNESVASHASTPCLCQGTDFA